MQRQPAAGGGSQPQAYNAISSSIWQWSLTVSHRQPSQHQYRQEIPASIRYGQLLTRVCARFIAHLGTGCPTQLIPDRQGLPARANTNSIGVVSIPVRGPSVAKPVPAWPPDTSQRHTQGQRAHKEHMLLKPAFRHSIYRDG